MGSKHNSCLFSNQYITFGYRINYSNIVHKQYKKELIIFDNFLWMNDMTEQQILNPTRFCDNDKMTF